MSPTINISVAVTEDFYGLSKHWAILLYKPCHPVITVLQVENTSYGDFYYAPKIVTKTYLEYVLSLDGLVDLVCLCTVDDDLVGWIKDIASEIAERNDIRDWEPRHFLIDLLKTLEEQGIIEDDDEDYVRKKSYLELMDG